MEEEVAIRLSKTAYLSTSLLPWVGGACEGTPVCCCSVPGAVAGGNWYLPCEPRWDFEEAGGGGRKGVAPKGSAGLCWKSNKMYKICWLILWYLTFIHDKYHLDGQKCCMDAFMAINALLVAQ